MSISQVNNDKKVIFTLMITIDYSTILISQRQNIYKSITFSY